MSSFANSGTLGLCPCNLDTAVSVRIYSCSRPFCFDSLGNPRDEPRWCSPCRGIECDFQLQLGMDVCFGKRLLQAVTLAKWKVEETLQPSPQMQWCPHHAPRNTTVWGFVLFLICVWILGFSWHLTVDVGQRDHEMLNGPCKRFRYPHRESGVRHPRGHRTKRAKDASLIFFTWCCHFHIWNFRNSSLAMSWTDERTFCSRLRLRTRPSFKPVLWQHEAIIKEGFLSIMLPLFRCSFCYWKAALVQLVWKREVDIAATTLLLCRIPNTPLYVRKRRDGVVWYDKFWVCM